MKVANLQLTQEQIHVLLDLLAATKGQDAGPVVQATSRRLREALARLRERPMEVAHG